MSPEENGICGGGGCIEGTRENGSVKVERGDEFEICCPFKGATSVEGRRRDD
jgi:hypothetical protein